MNNFNTIGSFFLGAVVGFTFGVLVAPEDGKTIRRKIIHEADKFAGELLKEADSQIKLNKHK